MASLAGTGTPSVGAPVGEGGAYKPIIHEVGETSAYTNSANLSVLNNSTNDVNGSQTPISSILNWNSNSILDDAEFLRVGIKATEGATIENAAADGAVPVISVGDASVGMAAENNSLANNEAVISVNAHNAAIGMAASSASLASNLSGASLNMIMTGNYATGASMTRIIGMYADTGASVSNETGGTILAENQAMSGTMVGMQASLVNTADETTKAVNNGTINMYNSDSVTPTSSNVSLVAMAGVLDKEIAEVSADSVPGRVELSNSGSITMTSNWDRPVTLTGMSLSGYGKATNGGSISISGSGTATVTGMYLSDSTSDAGELISSGTIDIDGGKFTAYGINVDSAGKGTNSNSITLNVSGGAGMKTDGGTIVNDGTITIEAGGAGMYADYGEAEERQHHKHVFRSGRVRKCWTVQLFRFKGRTHRSRKVNSKGNGAARYPCELHRPGIHHHRYDKRSS